ncbi:MAG: TIM-barrel domain-containing protein [Candidatus Dojkabacteria bacterium]
MESAYNLEDIFPRKIAAFCIEAGHIKEKVTQHKGFYSRKVLGYESKTGNFKQQEIGDTTLSLSDPTCSFLVHYQHDRIVIELRKTSRRNDVNFFRVSLKAFGDEHIFGCGEQWTHFDLKGRIVPIWIEEQGIGRGKDFTSSITRLIGVCGHEFTTNYSLPYFVSTKGYYCYVDTLAYCNLAFGTNTTALEIHGSFTKIIIAKGGFYNTKSIPDIGIQQTQPPEWLHNGSIVALQGGYKAVTSKLQHLLDNKTAICAVWMQDWNGGRYSVTGKNALWDFVLKEELHPEFTRIRKHLARHDIKALGYVNPFLIKGGQMYAEALKHKYLVARKSGTPYLLRPLTFECGMVDLTNPEAYTWYKNSLVENMAGIGLSGWMADFGEYAPLDAQYHDRSVAADDVHTLYAKKWVQLQYDILKDNPELFIFVRAGWLGTNSMTQHLWGGDQLTNYSLDGGFATSVLAGITAGISGIGAYHSDIGGFMTLPWARRKQCLLKRWTEQSTFSPLMRTHESNLPALNTHVYSSGELIRHFACMTRIHQHIKSYILLLLEEYYDSGIPPMRPLIYKYPDNEYLLHYPYQYLLGEELLICPVIVKEDFRFYISEHGWINIWDGEEAQPGEHFFDYDKLTPVFYKNNCDHKALFQQVSSMVSL